MRWPYYVPKQDIQIPTHMVWYMVVTVICIMILCRHYLGDQHAELAAQGK